MTDTTVKPLDQILELRMKARKATNLEDKRHYELLETLYTIAYEARKLGKIIENK